MLKAKDLVVHRVGFLYDERFLLHAPPSGHPERPERLKNTITHLKQLPLWNELVHISPVAATERDILAVHSKEHFHFIKSVCARGGGMLDEGDTHAVSASFDVAMLAAGAVCTAIDSVLTKKVDAAFCAVRPPGHHAEKNHPMGFCLFNNVAVGARYAQRQHGVQRVAILDWDVHHGNGTQHIFEDDPTVLYISLHQYPFYPGTGARDEKGTGDGEGFTLNIPLPAGTGEERYIEAFTEEVVPALHKFQPELLIISAGFDAHRDDPLGGMLLSDGSFAKFTALVNGIAPIVSVLEGGYDLEALAKSAMAHLVELGR
jgi:acetoin utilization deacetylase AcuC-like enzyme